MAHREDVIVALQENPEMVHEVFKAYVKDNSNLWAAVAFDTSGKVVSGNMACGQSMGGLDISSREYAKQALAGTSGFISKTIMKSKTDGALIFALSSPDLRSW